MHPIRAVLFDLDDTLWPIVPVIKRAESILFDWLTINAPDVTRHFTIDRLRERRLALLEENPDYALDLRKLRHAGLTEAFISVGEDPGKVDAAIAIFSTARNQVTPYDDVVPSLCRLAQRFALGSVSNGVADLETIGLAGFFQTSVAAHRFGSMKPDPGIFHAACAELGVAPRETLYVGDDPLLDVEGAQKAGLHAAWMNRQGLKPGFVLPDTVCPDLVCCTLYEVDQWLTEREMLAAAPRAR